jgi:hypothetical protein
MELGEVNMRTMKARLLAANNSEDALRILHRNGAYLIGEGSSRHAYSLGPVGESLVAKVAINESGITQMGREADYLLAQFGVFNSPLDTSKSLVVGIYPWVDTKRFKPRFARWAGIEFAQWAEKISINWNYRKSWRRHEEFRSTLFRFHEEGDLSNTITPAFVQFCTALYSAVGDYPNLINGDLLRKDHYGFLDENLKIIDFGYWTEDLG